MAVSPRARHSVRDFLSIKWRNMINFEKKVRQKGYNKYPYSSDRRKLNKYWKEDIKEDCGMITAYFLNNK